MTERERDNTAGWGWFLDPAPGDDAEFTTSGNQGEQPRMDLLSVLRHERDHLLGLGHTSDSVLCETLAPASSAFRRPVPT